MLHFPHAKINLGLRVVNKRPDGYHDIETVMVPIGWSDALELAIRRGGDRATGRRGDEAIRFSYTRSGIHVPGDSGDDLVVKAYRLFKAYAESKGYSLPDIQAHLHKCIPPGSGLGGGSSNGASMLKLMADIFQDRWPSQKIRSDLAIMAGQLGSDCPFFLHDTPMLATGRGDSLTPISIPALNGMHLMVVAPPVQISTREAYAAVTPKTYSGSLAGLVQQPMNTWKETLKNDFEPWAFHHHPTIREIKEKLYEMGAVYASMSGTGSAVYGIFDGDPGRSVFDDSEGYRVWAGVI